MAAKEKSSRVKRKYVRFNPDLGDYVIILVEDKTKKIIPHVALLVEEAYGGCQIAVTRDLALKKGTKMRVKVGRMDPCWAQVKWTKELGTKITTMGLEYATDQTV